MNGQQEVSYALDFGASWRGRGEGDEAVGKPKLTDEKADEAISRIARLMALAIRFEGLLREGTMRDYAELARLGGVTRARMTQIMKLLSLAPDIQEQILFLPPLAGMNERNLRPIAKQLDWQKQRRLFQEFRDTAASVSGHGRS